ncbi:hypothetical protein J5A71_10195 [Prevotella melaninogenica]|uniref:hypothetical protein n=1 Tax=Prevotella melaninogenica TaxID=28132 RepID=UPI001BAE4117|nr:hypothetical protein [Prevotella melaninogenica]QUB57175.1 hypothetical protein J5A72_12130 [Prevotella melaninogenica]QUB59089.1 hypothetical protein J5A71_10195 [Prevotella melaninogenica]
MNNKNQYNLLVALFLLLVGSFAVSCSKDDDATTDNTSTFAPISSEEALKVQKSIPGKYRGNVHVYDPSTKKNYYSNSKLDLDSLIIYDKKKYNYGYLNLSRDTYVQLHNIEKTATNDTLSEIFTKRDEKANIELEGIRFTSRNQQDSCVYRFEVSRGDVDFVDRSHKIESARYLRTYFNGYGYYNVKTSKVKIYLRPFNAYTMLYHETLEYGRIPLTGRYLVYELTKVQ